MSRAFAKPPHYFVPNPDPALLHAYYITHVSCWCLACASEPSRPKQGPAALLQETQDIAIEAGLNMGWYASFKGACKALKHEILAIYYAMKVRGRECRR